jgi:hypothetical protein
MDTDMAASRRAVIAQARSDGSDIAVQTRVRRRLARLAET